MEKHEKYKVFIEYRKRYFRCIVKTFLKPLTSEEEEECLRLVESGDQEAREKLILHNMRLVAHATKKYCGMDEEMEELISIGTIGLIKAVSTFKCNFGSRFATYAIRCIDNEILMYFRSRRKRRGEVSLYEPIGTDKEGNQIQLVDVIENDEESVEDCITKNQEIEKVMSSVGKILTKREYEIITKRYGICGESELTQREIAGQLGISRSYVSRIEKNALRKLKEKL